MSFLSGQPHDQTERYEKLLKAVGALSKLFSESPEPYISSRAAENIFCKAFVADNLSRSDASADASKNGVGFGIKTFLHKNGRPMEKVAEFNGDHALFDQLPLTEKIQKIATLRNERIETTKRIFGLSDLTYHCVTRSIGKITIYESPFLPINIDKIDNKKIQLRGNIISFTDDREDYSFNIPKSTLYKRFLAGDSALEIPVRIITDPFAEIESLIDRAGLIFAPEKIAPHAFLPLYATARGEKRVPERSGLNQWNAGGRSRDSNEVYIPIPAWMHRHFPNFFPPRDQTFELMLPDRHTMNAKVCQENSKALMSNPNAALGKWLLRDVLNLQERELLTYQKLQTIGLDSVVVYKIDNEHYDIDFTRIGSYERFEALNSASSATDDGVADES
ncbi:MAG: hypothetical protein ACR2KT_11925 [Methylocella sp.]|nr:MAG: NgoFVII family restriction endonuclease [Hyphomicrobiales bacterium]